MEKGLVILSDKNIIWYKNDKYHREDGPAVIYCNFAGEEWYYEGILHRVDGPAISLGSQKRWYLNGKLHRKDGPAIEYNGEAMGWYYNGEEINVSSKEEFERLLNLKPFW